MESDIIHLQTFVLFLRKMFSDASNSSWNRVFQTWNEIVTLADNINHAETLSHSLQTTPLHIDGRSIAELRSPVSPCNNHFFAHRTCPWYFGESIHYLGVHFQIKRRALYYFARAVHELREGKQSGTVSARHKRNNIINMNERRFAFFGLICETVLFVFQRFARKLALFARKVCFDTRL